MKAARNDTPRVEQATPPEDMLPIRWGSLASLGENPEPELAYLACSDATARLIPGTRASEYFEGLGKAFDALAKLGSQDDKPKEQRLRVFGASSVEAAEKLLAGG